MGLLCLSFPLKGTFLKQTGLRGIPGVPLTLLPSPVLRQQARRGTAAGGLLSSLTSSGTHSEAPAPCFKHSGSRCSTAANDHVPWTSVAVREFKYTAARTLGGALIACMAVFSIELCAAFYCSMIISHVLLPSPQLDVPRRETDVLSMITLFLPPQQGSAECQADPQGGVR